MNALRAMTRLLDIKRRQADAAEAEHAKLQLALLRVRQEADSAERTWDRLAVEKPQVKTVSDLEDHVTSLRLCRRIADLATKQAEMVEAQCMQALAKLTDARREVSRYETWLERQLGEQAAEARRQERVREDEHAARKRSVA